LAAVTTLCITPGPAVLLAVSQALARGTASANWSILGVEAGNVFITLCRQPDWVRYYSRRTSFFR
jgi:threonine/homoserine/homoserine lactone efflux protein